MWFIVIIFSLGVVMLLFVVIGIALSAFSAVGGYDDVYENAREERYSRKEQQMMEAEADRNYAIFKRMHPEMFKQGSGDVYVDVDARSVHLHGTGANYLQEGAKNG